MRDNPSSQNNDEIKELVRQFQNLKNGKSHSFLDEDSFEKIIDYYDDEEDLQQALVAAELGIELFLTHPYYISRKQTCS